MSTPTRICSLCHTPLASGEQFCGNCGTPYIEPSSIDPTQRAAGSSPNVGNSGYADAPSPYGSTNYGPQGQAFPPPPPGYNPNSAPTYNPNPNAQPGYTTPSTTPAYNPNLNAQSGYTTPAYNPNLNAQPGYNSSTTPAYNPNPNAQPGYNPNSSAGGYPGDPGMYGMQPQVGNYNSIPPLPQPPLQSKKGPKTWLIVLLAVAAVVLVICAASGIFALNLNNHSTTNNTSTATPGKATAQPTVQPLFVDKFANNSNNWDVTNDKGFSSSIANNILTLQEANKRVYPMQIPTKQSYNDFAATTAFTLIQGDENDSAGLLLRAGQSNDGYIGYYFDIYGDGSYDIAKVTAGSNQQNVATELVEPTTSSSVNEKGTANTMQVIMKGSTIALYINNTHLQTITDTDFSTGSAFLFAENGNTSNGVIATFSSVEIDQAPDTVPSTSV